MKKLIFIALMFGFLIGNAQQDGQQFRHNDAGKKSQLNTDKHPGIRSEVDLYRNKIAKPLNATGLPFESDPYAKEMMKPYSHPGHPFESQPYEKELMKPYKGLGHPYESYKYLKTIRKTD